MLEIIYTKNPNQNQNSQGNNSDWVGFGLDCLGLHGGENTFLDFLSPQSTTTHSLVARAERKNGNGGERRLILEVNFGVESGLPLEGVGG